MDRNESLFDSVECPAGHTLGITDGRTLYIGGVKIRESVTLHCECGKFKHFRVNTTKQGRGRAGAAAAAAVAALMPGQLAAIPSS